MDELKRSVKFFPAYDKRHDDPQKNFGIGGVTIHFLLQGPKGAISWELLTTWDLKHVEKEQDARGWHRKPTANAVCTHSPVPTREDHEPRPCEYVYGATQCYSDARFCAGDEVFQALIEEGDDAVWKKLEEFYHYDFGGGADG